MKRITKILKTYLLLIGILLIFLLDVCLAREDHRNQLASLTIKEDAQLIDANQIAMYIMNNGTFARHPETGNAGFFYPKNSDKTAIFVARLEIAGKINGEIRTACANYKVEYQPGIILRDGSPDNPDLDKYRVYKIKTGDSANPGDPNYNRDYAEWPIDDGAAIPGKCNLIRNLFYR